MCSEPLGGGAHFPLGGLGLRKPCRFYGSVEIDMVRPMKSFDAIVNAVVMELQRTLGAQIKLTLEIEREAPDGFAEGEVSVVRDNAKQLKFKPESTGFEEYGHAAIVLWAMRNAVRMGSGPGPKSAIPCTHGLQCALARLSLTRRATSRAAPLGICYDSRLEWVPHDRAMEECGSGFTRRYSVAWLVARAAIFAVPRARECGKVG